MAMQVMLAVAGAGKTYQICHMLDITKKNLILAFTHENIHNILSELVDAYGAVPELTSVMTFHSFVYRYLILPYEPTIREHFGEPGFVSRGVTTNDPPPQRIKAKNGLTINNPRYQAKNKFGHYVTNTGYYYCTTLSELALQVKKNNKTLLKRAASGINMFFDKVLVDEFQDFREYDYEVIVGLANEIQDTVLVGDYFQHSVSGRNNTGKPFKKQKTDIAYQPFVCGLKQLGFEVDNASMNRSRRCAPSICRFIQEKLGISIESDGVHLGTVEWVTEDTIVPLLEDRNIVKLLIKEAGNYSFNAMNWGYSKGDTFEAVCVILTAKLEKLDCDSFSVEDIDISTRNKLYVAMTRTKGNLYLLKESLFKKYKTRYLKVEK